jgi:thermitase
MRASSSFMIVLVLAGVALAFADSGMGEELGPVVAIDLEESAIPDISTLDSVYSGDATRIYAFVVIDGMPGGYVSAYDMGFELISRDSSVINMGFSPLPGWLSLRAAEQAFPDDIVLPGCQCPAAIGFWDLRLLRGLSSSGEFRLTGVSRSAAESITLLDGIGLPVRPRRVHGGSINPPPVWPEDSLPRTWEYVRRDHLGRSISENRAAEHVPGRVIARFVRGMIDLPEGQSFGSASNITNGQVAYVAEQFRLTRVERACRNATRGGREVISRTGELVTVMDLWDIYVFEFPLDAPVWAIVDSLRAIPQCLFAQPNFTSKLRITPNDAKYDDEAQWNLFKMSMEAAWDDQVGSTEVRIGVLDSGIDWNHPDLGEGFGPGFKIRGGWDYVNEDDHPMDDGAIGHGTMVAGMAAALTNNWIGIAGVAGGWGPGNAGCSLYALKISDVAGRIDDLDAFNAMCDAGPSYGIDVINASWGGYDSDALLEGGVVEARKEGIVFVAAKGDRGTDDRSWPCDYNDDWVISVGASTWGFEHRVSGIGGGYGSDYGWDIDMLAPSGGLSTRRTSFSPLYWAFGGTSGAVPNVTGLAALILSTPGSDTLAVEDIEGIIEASCDDIRYDPLVPELDLIGYDEYSGWGRPNAEKVMQLLDCPGYELLHYTATGGYVVGQTDYDPLVLYGEGWPAEGCYYAKRYDVRCDASFPATFSVGPHVWGRGYGASTGWSGRTPNFRMGWCRVVPGTITQTGCQLQSFVYYVRDVWGTPIGWLPCPPNEVVFAYSALGG